MHDKLNRGLRTPWSAVLSDNVGVGPLVALRYWWRIILGHPPARSEYRHLGAVHDYVPFPACLQAVWPSARALLPLECTPCPVCRFAVCSVM